MSYSSTIACAAALLALGCANPIGGEPCGDAATLCAEARRTCGAGEIVDRCGEVVTVDCGECGADERCSEIGQCIDEACVPEDDATFCGREGIGCGPRDGTDNCGQLRAFECGGCGDGRVCSPVAQCIDESCSPETDQALCERVSVTCGDYAGVDNCEQTRVVTCGLPCMSEGAPGWFGEFEVADPVYAPSRESSRMLTVDVGTHYVVLWHDDRGDGSGWAVSEALLATRVSYAGEVLDPGGVMIVEPGANGFLAAVAFDGVEIVLALTEYVSEDVRELVLVRLGADARPVDAPAVTVASEWVSNVHAVFDGDDVVLAWVGGPRYAERVKVVSVTPRTLALGATHTVSDADVYPSHLSVAEHDGLTMLAWIDGTVASHHLRTARLGADGAPTVEGAVELVDSLGPLIVRSYAQNHSLVATPTGFAMLHEHRDLDTQMRRLHAQFFDADGDPIDATPLLLHERAAPDASSGDLDSHFARSGTLGDDWLVVYRHGGDEHGLVVDSATRTVSAPARRIELADGNGDNFACHRTECTLAEYHYSGSFRRGRLHFLDAAFNPTGSVDAATSAPLQNAPSLAFDGTQYLVLWLERAADRFLDGGHLFLRRLSPEGRWLDPAPVEVPVTDEPRYTFGATPYAGGGFLVRWSEQDADYDDHLFVRRMAADGTWAWPAAIDVEVYATTLPSFGESACSSSRCILTFTRDWDTWEYVVFDADGIALAAPAVVPDLTDDRIAPAVRFDGAGTFVLAFISDDVVHIRTVNATTGAVGTTSLDVAADPDVQRGGAFWHRHGAETLLISSASEPDASADGYRYFVEARTWDGASLSAPFVLVDELEPPLEVVGAVSHGTSIEVYLLSVSPLFFPTGSLELLVRARHERGVGMVEAASPFLQPAWFGSTSVAGDLLAYERIDWDVGFGDERVRLTFVGDRSALLDDNAVCIDDGQCASGRCRAGLCCDECSLWKGL